MRKSLIAFLLSGGALLALPLSSGEVLAAGASVPREAIAASDRSIVRVGGYGWQRDHRWHGRRHYHRRPAVHGYYARPPRVVYLPPVVYYPPPIVVYPPPIVYGGYAVAAPYGYYDAPRVRYYRDYGW